MQIRFIGDEVVAPVTEATASILDVAIAQKIPHYRECGGSARCTTCRVRILDGLQHVSKRSAQETAIAAQRGWDDTTRLACQTRVSGDVSLERLIRAGGDVAELQVEAVPADTGQELPLAILVCDMRDFTPFVEQHLAYDVVHMLNRFFTKLGTPILLNNGLIYQYVGDEISALFGVGGDTAEQSCLNVVRAGLGMLAALQELNETLQESFGLQFRVGIGAHFGPTIVGHVGHPSHRQFGVVGDTMNVASRIEAMNKNLDTRFLISQEVQRHLPHTMLAGKTADVALKGKSQSFHLVEVLGFPSPDATLLVQSTIEQVLAQQDRLTEELYRRLFTLAPEAKALFRGNMDAQRQALARMLESLVYGLSRPEHLALGLRDLGRRHAQYGVQPAHYGVLRQALLETLAVVLRERYTPAVKQAWASTLDMISHIMLEGAAHRT